MTVQATSREAAQQQVYFDVTVDGEPKGRLVVQLSGDAPVGTKRFAQLSQGLNGVGYRLSKFDGIAQVTMVYALAAAHLSHQRTCFVCCNVFAESPQRRRQQQQQRQQKQQHVTSFSHT